MVSACSMVRLCDNTKNTNENTNGNIRAGYVVQQQPEAIMMINRYSLQLYTQ